MTLRLARNPGWLRAAITVVFLGLLPACQARQAEAQAMKMPPGLDKPPRGFSDVRSEHFLLHTDLAHDDADRLVERLETLLARMSKYWGRPLRGVIECYVAKNLNEFPVAAVTPFGVDQVRTAGGVTWMRVIGEGKWQQPKGTVVACARPEVVQHEAVHAYCHQVFGRIGPVWYSEGMAELGRYGEEGHAAVRADPREIEFLRKYKPTSLTQMLSGNQVSGDSWQNYAVRWSLCHFLTCNPNYAKQFHRLGRGLLTGKNVSFEQTFGDRMQPLLFEYRLFLTHIDRGYRVERCAWDWCKSFACLPANSPLTVDIAAGRGWQPTGLTVCSGVKYDYRTEGTWRAAGASEAVDASGDSRGRGRLVGVLLKDLQLGPEFELGGQGSIQLKSEGDLYLRCRTAWNELADDEGRISVQFVAQDPTSCAAQDGE